MRCTFELESVGTQSYVSKGSTESESLPQNGFIGILVARQSSGKVFSRVNAAQFVYTEHWGALERIIISRTETDQVNFPLRRKIQNVGGEEGGAQSLSKVKLVYISHARPIGTPLLNKEELNEWTDIGWTKEVRLWSDGIRVGSEGFESGPYRYTVWLGKVVGTFLVDRHHGSPPEDDVYLKDCRRDDCFIRTEEGD